MIYETIIIGAGIAGQTAAIYAARKRMNFLIISKDIGGQFLESGEVLNYPGIIKTTGAEFNSLMEKQLKFNGVAVKEEEVVKIEKKKEYYVIKTNKNTHQSKTIILATGARARRLNIPGEDRLQNKGLTYCSVCDGPLFSGMDVAIIGGGDSALEAVDFMLNIAKKIYLVNNSDTFKAHEYLQERIKSHSKVNVILNANTKEILGDKFVTGIKYEQNGKIKELKVQAVIIEIGRVPNTEFVRGFAPVDEHDHIIIDAQKNTKIPGIFAAGDCASGHEYQYVIAAGEGCMALLKAARYLAKKP